MRYRPISMKLPQRLGPTKEHSPNEPEKEDGGQSMRKPLREGEKGKSMFARTDRLSKEKEGTTPTFYVCAARCTGGRIIPSPPPTSLCPSFTSLFLGFGGRKEEKRRNQRLKGLRVKKHGSQRRHRKGVAPRNRCSFIVCESDSAKKDENALRQRR